MGNALGAVTSVVATLTVVSAPSNAGAIDVTFQPDPGADDLIRAVILQPDGKAIVGGLFTDFAGAPRNRVARVNPDGSLDDAFDPGLGADGAVHAIALQSDGKVVIGGTFTNVGGAPRWRIARLDADGRLDLSFDPGLGARDNPLHPETPVSVSAVAIQPDGKVIVGGDFHYIDQVNRPYLTRLLSDGRVDTSFYADILPYESAVAINTLAIQSDGRILVGGRFTASGKLKVVRLNANGAVDPGFSLSFVPYTIYSLALQGDGKILLGGAADWSSQSWSRGVARLLPNGSVDPTFNPTGLASPYTYQVRAVAAHHCGRVLVGGRLALSNGPPRTQLVRLLDDGSLDSAFTPGSPDGSVYSIAVAPDGKVVAGGIFTEFNGARRHSLMRLNDDPPEAPIITRQPTDVTVDAGRQAAFAVQANQCSVTFQWQLNGVDIPGATNATLVLLNPRSTNAGSYRVAVQTVLGQIFSDAATLTVTVGPEPWRPGSVSLDFYPYLANTNQLTAWSVRADGEMVVGLAFTNIIGQPTYRVARLAADGSVKSGFGDDFRPSQRISVLGVGPDGRVYVGGDFTEVNGGFQVGLARLDAFGHYDTTGWGYADPPVYAVALQPDEKILVASYRTVARFSPDAQGTDFTRYCYFGGSPMTVAVLGNGKILLGGSFLDVKGTRFARVARLHSDGLPDSAFDPGVGANDSVYAMAPTRGNQIIIAGAFTGFNGAPRSRVARLHDEGRLDLNFDPGPGPNSNVLAVALQPDGKVWIGGAFTSVSGSPRNYLARLNADGSLDTTLALGAGPNGPVRWLAWRHDGRLFVGGDFTEVDGFARNGVALLNVEPWLFRPTVDDHAFRLTVPTSFGHTYVLEFREALESGSWATVSSAVGDGSIRTLADTNPAGPQRFYRVRVD